MISTARRPDRFEPQRPALLRPGLAAANVNPDTVLEAYSLWHIDRTSLYSPLATSCKAKRASSRSVRTRHFTTPLALSRLAAADRRHGIGNCRAQQGEGSLDITQTVVGAFARPDALPRKPTGRIIAVDPPTPLTAAA
jgi:hypothetical protein